MANSFNKEEVVAFENMLEGFEDALVLSRAVSRMPTDPQSMERASDVFWRPQPYIAQSFDGMDQTANFKDQTQLSVPATLGFSKSVPWILDAKELRDALQEGNLKQAAEQKLATDINVAIANIAAMQGTLFVKRTAAASGFDDVAECDALMNEQGIGMGERHIAFSSRDYNSMASNLASRQTMNQKPITAYERALIGDNIAGFTAWKLDYAPRITAAAGTGVVINDATAANRRYVPVATALGTTGRNNVDNRYMNLAVTVGGGTYKVGDAFTIAGVNAVHHITKADTGRLKTFRVTAIVSGAGGTGVMQFSPPIIVADGATDAEKQYANVTTTPANGAALVFLNTAAGALNPFWKKEAIELLPGRYAIPSDSGLSVLRGTTKQGVEFTLSKSASIDTLKQKYRADVFFGGVMLQPEMCGVEMFSQP